MKKVTFVIGKDGKILTDFDGFQGEHCLTESTKIMEQLKNSGVESSRESIEEKPELKVRVLNETKAH